MTGADMKQKIKESGFYQWQVALETGVTEMTLIRWLRTTLTAEQTERVNSALERVIAGGVQNG